MAYCLPNLLLLLSFSLVISSLAATTTTTAVITNHGGPLLAGNLNLTYIWYGRFGRSTKNVMAAFVKSLTKDGVYSLQPHVTEWWNIVEGFQLANAPINVQVGKQFTDANCSVGKFVTPDSVKGLVQKYNGGTPYAVPVIFTARGVKVQGLCNGNCSIHGVLGN